jgi:peptidoglycan/LPS O-acetylase OafA/YrhL
LSFGMYLNHEYMLPWIVHTILPRLPFSTFSRLLTNLVGVVIATLFSAGIALITFCLVEYPFLQIRKNVLGHRSKNTAAPDLSPVSR